MSAIATPVFGKTKLAGDATSLGRKYLEILAAEHAMAADAADFGFLLGLGYDAMLPYNPDYDLKFDLPYFCWNKKGESIMDKTHWCEVVGNIYENPKLLKAKKTKYGTRTTPPTTNKNDAE